MCFSHQEAPNQDWEPIHIEPITFVEKNQLPNCPITRADIGALDDISGQDIGAAIGKTVRWPPYQENTYLDPMSRGILNQYKNVTVAGGIMFVDGIPFLVTIMCNI